MSNIKKVVSALFIAGACLAIASWLMFVLPTITKLGRSHEAIEQRSADVRELSAALETLSDAQLEKQDFYLRFGVHADIEARDLQAQLCLERFQNIEAPKELLNVHRASLSSLQQLILSVRLENKTNELLEKARVEVSHAHRGDLGRGIVGGP